MLEATLSGKRLLVTGGASGIGLAVTERCARLGARVAVNFLPGDARGPREVERLKSEGLAVHEAPGDVARAEDVPPMVSGAIARLGGLDYLFNNAGTPGSDPPYDYARLELMTESFWHTLLEVNLLGMFRVASEARAALVERRGAIVNTASVAGLTFRGSSIAYGATKAAVINLTVNLARSLAPHVRVNAIAPGFVDTPFTANWPADRRQAVIERTLLKRAGTPEDIAEAAVFLLAGNRYITGQTLVADGGLTIGD